MKLPRIRHINSTSLVLVSSLFLTLFYNHAFFSEFASVYQLTIENITFFLSVGLLLFCVTALLLILVDTRYTTKPVLVTVFLLSALASYFMDSYHIIIDSTMIQNIVLTDPGEVRDMFSINLILYILLLGLLPAFIVFKARLVYGTRKNGLVSKFKFIAILVAVIASQLLVFGKSYASFFREHKEVRYYTNPVTYIYSMEKYVKNRFSVPDGQLVAIGTDARKVPADVDRELTIMVVGETVRADRLSLNGYDKPTTPLLEKENVISLKNMHSCGTSTAVSVPCMFSMYKKSDYSDTRALDHENLLDVLSHAGVHVLWRDNNSDSKGVALRVNYQDYKSPSVNHACDIECRDEGMLEGLQEFIDGIAAGDILIVLHQMGSHGPAYYKRYPDQFEKFTPVCKTSHLEDCSEQEINNAYDNTILYLDHFLSQVIELLKRNQQEFETTLMYVSDHGESLGEKGIYLHGLPSLLAPDAQTHVASLLWFGEHHDAIDVADVRKRELRDYSHDNVFHTVLGLMEIETTLYDRDMDIVFSD